MSTLNNGIPFIPDGVIDPAAALNLSLQKADALIQCIVKTVGENTPPTNPIEGDRHIVGTTPTGAWATHASQLARYANAAWEFHNAAIAVNLTDKKMYFNNGTNWETIST